jgi:hypothetical protein
MYWQKTMWERDGGRLVAALMVSLTETVPERFESVANSGRLPDVLSISTHRRPDTSPCCEMIGVW